MLQMNPPDDWLKTGWARDSQTRTRLVDSLFCITCSLENNAFSVLRYTTLCYIASRFILPPHSLASSWGCSLAITSLQDGTTLTSFQVDTNNNYFKLFELFKLIVHCLWYLHKWKIKHLTEKSCTNVLRKLIVNHSFNSCNIRDRSFFMG